MIKDTLIGPSGCRGRWFLGAVLVLAAGVVLGLGQLADDTRTQRGSGGGGNKLIREPGPAARAGVPEWTINEQFRSDIFTFARLRYRSTRRGQGGRLMTRFNDYPGADLNFSYRLEQLTSMKVDPEGLILDIDDARLFNYPFVFISDPRGLVFSDEDAAILRRYFNSGGFLMIDDIWGNQMWNDLMVEMEKVFPGRKSISLGLSHSLFNIPFVLKEKPQVPSEDSAHATASLTGLRRTWEFEINWEEPQAADYRALLDDQGRIVVLICWNTDLGDGWEEEGVSEWYFSNFAEKLSYPMGINIIVYAMTH